MSGREVTTAEDLEAMTPAERQASFQASVVRDLSDLPAEELEAVQADARDVLARRAQGESSTARAS